LAIGQGVVNMPANLIAETAADPPFDDKGYRLGSCSFRSAFISVD